MGPFPIMLLPEATAGRPNKAFLSRAFPGAPRHKSATKNSPAKPLRLIVSLQRRFEQGGAPRCESWLWVGTALDGHGHSP